MKKRLSKFTKHDSQKTRLDLTPASAWDIVGMVLRLGGIKYPDEENWRKCKDPTRFVAAMLRHMSKHMQREFLDKESGYPHLAHAVCSGLFALELYLKGEQDRFTMGNYFAVVKKRARGKGKILQRYNTYDKAYEHLEELNQETHTIKTVTAREKKGMIVRV